jgi:hypothetical protein
MGANEDYAKILGIETERKLKQLELNNEKDYTFKMRVPEHKDFFNTTNEPMNKVREYREKATAQQIRILNYFRERQGSNYTPDEIQKNIAEFWETPITSIRRSMTNLTTMGFLTKLPGKRMGRYGRMTHIWMYGPLYKIN